MSNLYLVGNLEPGRVKYLMRFIVADDSKQAVSTGKRILEQYPIAYVNISSVEAIKLPFSTNEMKPDCFVLIENGETKVLSNRELNKKVVRERILRGSRLIQLDAPKLAK